MLKAFSAGAVLAGVFKPTRWLLAAALLLPGAVGAVSEDWSTVTASGSAVVETEAGASALHAGDLIPRGASVKTGPESQIRLKRPGVELVLAANATAQISRSASSNIETIVAHAGIVGADLASAFASGLKVRTANLNVLATDAAFGVETEGETALVVARRGAVRVTIPKSDAGADLGVDQVARYTPQGGLVVGKLADMPSAALAAATADAAMGQARPAAKDAPRLTDPDSNAAQKPAKPLTDEVQARLLMIHGGAYGGDWSLHFLATNEPAKNATLSDAATAISRLTPERVEIDVGDAEGAAELAQAGVPREIIIKYHVHNVKQALLHLRYFHALAYLDASTAAVLVGLLLFAAYLIGALTNAILRTAGFGVVGNAGLNLLGLLIGAAVRDIFFFSDFWFDYEPDVSIVLAIGGAFVALLAACFAKAFLRNDENGENSPAPASARFRVVGGFRKLKL